MTEESYNKIVEDIKNLTDEEYNELLAKCPTICCTCQFHNGIEGKCNKNNTRISYEMCFEHKCEDYELSDNYKKGGKFYKEQI